LTITLKVHVVVFPEASVETDVTVVVPIGNSEPEAGVDITDAEQLSVVPTEKFTIAPHVAGSEFTVISAGQVIPGDSLSITAISKEQLEVFPAASVAVELTVVCPTGNTDPEAGVLTTVAAQLSVPVTVKFTVAPQIPGAEFTDIFDGQVITGNVLSVIVT
jgi:hypothetical protein